MSYQSKLATTLITVITSVSLSTLAFAQDSYLSSLNNKNKINTTAGVHMTIPFGGKKSNKVTDKARFGLMLNMEREYDSRSFYVPRRVNTNLLDFGMQFNGRPTMLLGGEDIYMPLFTPEEYEQANLANAAPAKNTILIIAGGALAVGAAVALASGGGDNDDDGPDNDNDGDDN
jgi:hypothetical protein